MHILSRYIILSVLLLIGASAARAQFPASCDANKACVGNALTIEVTRGKGAQYVDVDTAGVLKTLTDAITFEAWIKPEPQPGKRVFVAGLWGPNRDNNDQWVVYIDNETISFALSPDASFLGNADNTVASVVVPGLNSRGWTHIACVWDGASTAARIYIDGYERARASSTTHPLTRLKVVESRKLPTQIGSCNGLYDDTTSNRTFKGQIDEVRIWSRALTDQEILCNRIASLAGNENGMLLYYRCNENASDQTLCDATGSGNVGYLRSGANQQRSDRELPWAYSAQPSSVSTTLYCTSDTTFTFTITDTSFCGNDITIGMVGADRALFTVTPRSATLVRGVPLIVTVRVDAQVIGRIQAQLRINNRNRCGRQINVPITLDRRTELDYSKGRLTTDTLYVGCIERTWSEDTLEICNRTGRAMQIQGATLVDGTIFSVRPLNPAETLPRTLPSGTCWSVVVRMSVGDTSHSEYDTLKIASDDRCPGSGVIPIEGRTQEVLKILNQSGSDRVESMNFGAVCPDQISDVRLYQVRNMVGESIEIDTIEITSPFFGRRNIYPITLLPNFAYQPTYIRFRPDRAGPFTGQVIFRTTYRGCTIVKTIDLAGRGISVNVNFDAAIAAFGNVTIGRVGTLTTNVTNRGDETRRMSAYLKVGDVFTITSPRQFNVVPGQSIPVALSFRPREQKTYYDTLCVFDEQCFQTICIPVSGTGVFDELSFSPSFLNMENAIGCRCRVDTLVVRNITASPITITQARLNDLTGKFTMIGAAQTGTLAPNAGFTYILRYCPDDLVTDRADQAFIDLALSNGGTYQVLVRGTSVIPKLYVTPLTAFGNVEVGWRKREMILVENASTVPVHITAVNVPAGYTVISANPAIPFTLMPRDSLWLEVELAPTAEVPYNGTLTLTSDDPCALSWSGDFTGRGEIVRLSVPVSFINYGLIRPCDCAVREILLPNLSSYIPMTVDSIWIDGVGVTNPRPQVFAWRSSQTGDTTLPYTIAPQTSDTLRITFCPNIPSIPANLVSNATVHISASTPSWNEKFGTVVSGRRELNFEPTPVLVQFPATRVDTSAQAISVRIDVPDAFQNPSGDSIVITGVSFLPDQRVFSVRTATNQPFPWVIQRGKRFDFLVDFYPRAPKNYEARLRLHTIFPCEGMDTTILVRGAGFAPAYGLQMAFDTAAVGLDTLRITTCDTLLVPVMISRDIPQPLIDIVFRIGYDSTALQLLDITSPFTSNATIVDTGDGARAYLKNAANAAAGEIAWVRFVPRGGAAAFAITLDEIDFDSDSLVFFKIVAGVDRGWVIIDDPLIAISPVNNFDTVNLKSCADQIVTVWNPGAVAVRFDSLAGLPIGHRITATSQPLPVVLAPGDSVTITVTFCPWVEGTYDATLLSRSMMPCPISDSGTMHSVGFAPPFPMRLLLSSDPNAAVTIGGVISDTIEVPIFVDRDVPQTPLDVNMTLEYNRRSLQFMGVTSPYSAAASGSTNGNGVTISLPGCDSLRAGEIARVRFVVTVPDQITSTIILRPEKFTSDSVFWVKLDPPITSGDTATVQVDPRCNISRLEFRNGVNRLSLPVPNPTSSHATIDVEIVEDVPVHLSLYNSAGIEVLVLVDSDEIMAGGSYRFDFNISGLPSGDYFCVLETPRFRDSRRLQIIK